MLSNDREYKEVLENKVCSACGKKATFVCMALVEIKPTNDGWEQCIQTDNIYYTCDDHAYSMYYRLDGTVDIKWYGEDEKKITVTIDPTLAARETQEHEEWVKEKIA